jgi:hypothetical protein
VKIVSPTSPAIQTLGKFLPSRASIRGENRRMEKPNMGISSGKCVSDPDAADGTADGGNI